MEHIINETSRYGTSIDANFKETNAEELFTFLQLVCLWDMSKSQIFMIISQPIPQLVDIRFVDRP